MKSFYYILLFLGTPLWLSAQSSTQNYVVTTVPYQVVSNPSSLSDANSNTTIQYFDGLGRPSQTVQRAITPTSADLVSGIEYDPFGRDYRHWLPGSVAGNSGAYVTNFGTPAVSTNGGDSKPYATTEYDGSPLNRVTGQYGAGVDWYNNTKKKTIDYTTNGSDVKHYYVDGTQLKCDGSYGAATLYGQKTTDEDGKTVEEFTDKQGRKVLSRVAGGNDTYYVYDDLDNLRYVLPPLAADALGTNTSGFGEGTGTPLDQYGYIYHYDGRKRCTEKKLPGCDWIYMVYDLADRLILSQDGNQRAKAQWTVNKYDLFGRLLYSGLINDGSSRSSMEANYSGSVTNESYTGSGPVVGYTSANLTPSTLLTVNYYDSYTFLTYSGNNPGGMLTNTTLSGYDNPASANPYAKTLLTGTRVYHLDNPSLFEVTAIYYDRYARVVQSRASNHLGGYDLTYNALNFTGKPTKTYKTHGISGASATYTELYSYFYNKAQQLLSIAHQLNGGTTVILVANTYDELGRLSTKTSGGTNAITHSDVTTYSYNVRNWTTGISGSQFIENLYYNTNTANLPTFTPAYNGNIAGMQWNVPGESLGYNRAYTFGYDGLNRLTDANYCGFNGSTVAGTTGKYDEHFGFDKMGNFNALTRYENGSLLNNLSFAYTGNQLKKVDNALSPYIPYGSEAFNDKQKVDTEYSYDQNGSIAWDVNTGISLIQYNLLNLPDQIQFTEGHKNLYTYDASGKKLEAVNYTVHNIINVPINTISTLPANPSDYTKLTTDYVGYMIYENGALKEILLSDGYWQSGVYYYYMKDHLGNNRVVINNSGAVIERSHYYPSGMRFYPESTSNSAALPYRYNCKELEAMNGLNQYDYGARRKGTGLPIWTAVDPLAEKYYSVSPYAYCAGNPVKFIDPSGMLLTDFEDGNGDLVKHIDDGSSAVFQQTGKGTDLHYEFKGYNENSNDPKVVNLTSAVQEQQQLNMENPALQQNAEGNNETHCNQATRDVMKTVDSALENKTSIVVNGRANDMAKTLSSGKNENYLKVNESEAAKNAQNGGLSLVTYMNPDPNKSGHIATFSVGANLVDGKIANIGTAQYTGFVSLNGAINKNKPKEYFILLPNVLPNVTAVGQKK
jgi:RHS repeat-associated protein